MDVSCRIVVHFEGLYFDSHRTIDEITRSVTKRGFFVAAFVLLRGSQLAIFV